MMVERKLRRIRRKPRQTLQDHADEIREVSRKAHMKIAVSSLRGLLSKVHLAMTI